MSGQPYPRRSLFAVWRWPRRVLIPLALLMLLGYPLSVGPAVWLAEHFHATNAVETAIEAIYFPLVIACEYIPPLERLLEVYLEWWD